MPLFLRKWPKCFIWKCLGAIPERSSTSSTALSRRLTLMPLPASMSSLMTSTLVHATLKDWTRAFDVAWIYALLHSVIAYSLHPVQVSAGRQGFKVSSHRSTGPCWITTGERDRGRDTQGQRSLARGFYDGDGHSLSYSGRLYRLTLFDSWLLSPFDDNNERRCWNPGHWLRYAADPLPS